MDSSNSGEDWCSSSTNDFFDSKIYTKTHDMIRWKSGKRVDPRILAILESFEEIYANRHDLFKKIFHEDHEVVFKKIGDALKRKKKIKKVRSMSRSLSMRTNGKRDIGEEVDELIRLERFKIRTPNVIVTGSDDGSQNGQIKFT